MIEESLLKSNFIGKDGFVWWIGQVANPSVWRNEKSRVDSEGSWAYRCKVRIIGYHTFDGNVLPDEDLPWAHVLTSASDGAPGQGGFGKTPDLIGGESVLGFFLDGEEGQQPVIVSCFYRNSSVKNSISPELINSEKSSQFKPFTGMQGNLSASNTRIKKAPDGKLQQPPTNVTESGPAITMQGSDFTSGPLGVSTSFNPFTLDTSLFAGTLGNPTPFVEDRLFYDDISSIGMLKLFYNVGNVDSENGCHTNYLAQIQSALQSFVGFINGLEKTVIGFIDPVRNKIVDVQKSIRKVAKLIASTIKFIINGMRDNVLKLVGCLFRAFSITIPLPQWLQLSEAAKNILDIIFCIFEKLYGPILDFIIGLLQGLIGKTPNIPRCAANELTASLIQKLFDLVDGALETVLSGLDWLTGGISQITSYLRQSLSYLNQVLSFLECDKLACKPTTSWNPFQGINFPNTDDWAECINKIDILNGYGGAVDEWVGLLSIYGSGDTPFADCRSTALNPQTQSDLIPMPPGTKFYSCVPPEVVINGDGVGASAVAVVEPNNGSILTIRVLNPGKGYTSPPNITIVDNSNYGSGALAGATINSNGNIESIYMISAGKGYCQTNPNVNLESTTTVSTSSTVSTGTTTTSTFVGFSTTPVGIITSIVVRSPGIGYTSGDTIVVGGCTYSPLVTNNGSIIGVNSTSSCNNQFTELPAVSINTKTGQGAVLYPVIQYIPQYVVDNPNTSTRVGLRTDQIVNVDLCSCEDC